MRLHNVQIENFLSISKTSINFEIGGICFVEGKNHDSSTAFSNGAGKSSIFESIYFAIYGKTKRSLTGDDIIHRKEKKCYVCVNLSIHGVKYTIERIKERKKPTMLFFFRGDEDLSLPTVKDTQTLIDEKIKINELTFLRMAYFGQGDVKPFASLTDSELKTVFEQSLGLSILSNYHQRIKGYISGINELLTGKEYKLTALKNEIINLSDKKDYLKGIIDDSKRMEDEERIALEIEEEKIRQNLTELMSEIEVYKIQHETLKEKITLINVESDELKHSKFLEALNEKRKAKDTITYTLNTTIDTKNDLQRQCDFISGKVGTLCGECGKTYKSEDLGTAIQTTKNKIEEINQQIKVLKNKEWTSIDNFENLSGLIDKHQEMINTKKTEKYGLVEETNKIVTNWNTNNIKIDTLNKQYVRVKQEKERLSTKYKSYDEDYTRVVNEIELREKDCKIVEDEFNKIKVEKDLTRQLEEIFSNGGMKSYIFDSITPELNKTINKYMSILDPDINIEISTMKKLKSGEYRDKFSINIENINGADIFKGSSGGEAQKINLAISLAFNQVIRSLCEADINILFLDEFTESLDSASIGSVVELLKTMTLDNIFVISHLPELAEAFEKKITIEKKDGYSKVVL